MSYIRNLGRVKGEEGQVYVPKIIEEEDENGIMQTYIDWELKDKPYDEPEPIKITSKVYIPVIDENGVIQFHLGDPTSSMTSGVNITGPQGAPGEVDTEVVGTLPDINDAKEGIIYIHPDDNDDNSLIATVFDQQSENGTGKFYNLDNLAKFSNYYTTTETDIKFCTNERIEEIFGDISQAQKAIMLTLDKGSVNIPSGE